MELKNYHANYRPETTLYREEVDVIVTVIESVLRRSQRQQTTGSFVLAEQQHGDDMVREILKFDFDDGAAENRYQEESSNWVAGHVVEVTSAMGFEEDGVIVRFPEPGFDEEVLSLKTATGRFVCAVCIGEYPYCEVEIYLAVAKAIAEMDKEDVVLQSAYKELLREEALCLPDLYSIDSYVTNLFKWRKEPKLKTWRDWRKKMNA